MKPQYPDRRTLHYLRTLRIAAHSESGLPFVPNHAKKLFFDMLKIPLLSIIGSADSRFPVSFFQAFKMLAGIWYQSLVGAVRLKPPPGEPLHRYIVLCDWYDVLSTTALKRGLMPPPVVLGTIPCGSIDAFATIPPGTDQRVILFHSSIYHFINKLGTALAGFFLRDPDLFEIGHPGALMKKLDLEATDPYSAVESAIIAFLTTGDPMQMTDIYAADKYTKALATLFGRPMGLFIVGHELGHFMSGHFDHDTRQVLHANDLTFESFSISEKEQEYEADSTGVVLASEALVEEDHLLNYGVTYPAVTFLLSGFGLLLRSLNLFRSGSWEEPTSKSHPRIDERISHLRENMEMLARIRPNHAKLVQSTLRTADRLEEFTKELEPRLQDAIRGVLGPTRA